MIRKVKPFGVLFWTLAIWGIAGSVSHIELGRDWLTVTNDAGIARWAQALAGIAFTMSAVTIRLAIISRRRVDHVGNFFTLVGFSCVLAGATFANVGIFQGRWPDSSMLWALHLTLQYCAVAVGVFAAIATFRVGLKSTMNVFRVPALVFGFLTGAIALTSLWEYASGAWIAFPALRILACVTIAIAIIRLSFLAPSKREQRHVQHTHGIKMP